MAIADASLRYLAETVGCRTLFITHYPLLAVELEKTYPSSIQNQHMGYTSYARLDGSTEIKFLYRLTNGHASGEQTSSSHDPQYLNPHGCSIFWYRMCSIGRHCGHDFESSHESGNNHE